MRRRMPSCGLLLALAVTMAGQAHAQRQQSDPLSTGQVEQIRELGDRPVERIKLLLKFVNDRTAAIKELTPDSTENSRPVELRGRYQEFTRLSDELSDNMDTYDRDHADLRKALRLVVAGSEKWPEILTGPAPNDTYDYERKTALYAARSTAEQAQELLAGEEKYFAAHKAEAGGNGKAPTPER